MYKGNDNWSNSYDYIINQLFLYDYSDTDDFNVLKMKIWVLDGDITTEDASGGFTDEDIDNPKNHFESIKNELTFLDRYIRTEEDDLERDPDTNEITESNFQELKQERIDGLQRWINTLKPPTSAGIYYQDWEQAYYLRPTLLTDSQFTLLYSTFVTKRTAGELDEADDILYEVTNYCIDTEIKRQETTVNTYEDPAITESKVVSAADASKAKNDFNYVTEMNTAYDEIFTLIKNQTVAISPWQFTTPYVIGDMVTYALSGDLLCVEAHTSSNSPTGSPIAPPDDTYWISLPEIFFINCPHKREQVSEVKYHSSHKGVIQAAEGYRFVYIKFNGDEKTGVPVPEVIDNVTNCTPLRETVAAQTVGQVEWNFDDFEFVVYFVDNTPEDNLMGLNYDRGTLASSAGTEFTIDAQTVERFDELNARWENINNLRDDQISNAGTRIIVESLYDVNIPDMSTDHQDHYDDKKDQKEYYTEILRERYAEFS